MGRPWATVLLLAAGCLLCQGLSAEEASESAQLEKACTAGLGERALVRECLLDIERIGATLRLRESWTKQEIICHLCTQAEARAAAYDLGVLLTRTKTQEPSTHLEFDPSTREFDLRLDGVSLPRGVESVAIAPGPHVVEFESAIGKAKAEITPEPDARLQAITSVRTPRDSALAWRPRDYLSWSVAAVGSGLTLGAMGGFLLWQDGQCARPVDAHGVCPRIQETTAAGAIAVAAGIVLEGIAVWWLWPRRGNRLVLEVKRRP